MKRIKIADTEFQVRQTSSGKTYTTFRFYVDGKEELQSGTVWSDESKMLKESVGKEVECDLTYNEQYKNYNVRFGGSGKGDGSATKGWTPRTGSSTYGYKGPKIGERRYLTHMTGYFKFILPKLIEATLQGLPSGGIALNEVLLAQLIQSAEKMSIATSIAVGQNVVEMGEAE